jgi:glutamate synthase (NADPH/NADH) small chain
VKCLYRRDRANMPGSQREVKHAEEEGVEFVWLSAPQGFLGKASSEGERVSHVRSVRIHLGMPDASGRQTPQEIPNSHVNIEADLVLKALGFDPEDLPSTMGTPDLDVTGWGTLKIDWRQMMTSIDGVFAAGDIVRGASLVVWAVRDGRDAAERIHDYLATKAAAVAVAAE